MSKKENANDKMGKWMTDISNMGLASKLEEGCEFCKGEVDMWGFSGKVAGEVKIEIWEDKSQDRDSDFYLNIDVMQDEENFKINYCPMCGRKLEDRQ